MPLVIPEGYGSAAFIITGSGGGTDPFVFTIGVDMSTWALTNVGLCNLLKEGWEDNFQDLLGNYLALDRVVLTLPIDEETTGSVQSTNAPVSGTASGNFMPAAGSIIIQKHTDFLGRKGRGRMFLPGIAREDHIGANGDVDNDLKSDVIAAMTGWITANPFDNTDTDYVTPVLLHSDDTPPYPIVGLTVAPLVGWIRSRIR